MKLKNPELCDKHLLGHLGHFKEQRFINEGHNDVSEHRKEMQARQRARDEAAARRLTGSGAEQEEEQKGAAQRISQGFFNNTGLGSIRKK